MRVSIFQEYSSYQLILNGLVETINPVVKAFSARANSRAVFRIVDTKANPNVIDCLHGIRCLSFIWVVYCHDYLVFATSPNINMGYVLTVR